MAARHRYWVVLVLGSLGPGSPGWALPPCGPPGTITTVTAPEGGDYIAAFRDYKIYPSEYLSVGGGVDLVAAPDYRSYYPQNLALGPQGRVHIADMTIIYRLEDDGSATRIVGVPQYSTQEDDARTGGAPLLRKTNVLQDTVAALEARIAPGPMAFDRHGRLYFVDYVNRGGIQRTEARIARLEADGQVTTFAARVESGPFSSLLFDSGGQLLVGGMGGIQRIDTQGVISRLRLVTRWAGAMRLDDEGRLHFSNGRKIFRRLDDGTLEVVAGSDWGDENHGSIRYTPEYAANGRPATEAPLSVFDFVIDARGVLYIANFGYGRIHRVGADGALETIAGDGRDYAYIAACFAGKRVAAGKRLSRHRCRDQIGDGGPALDAPVWQPFLLLLTPEGDLLVAMRRPAADWDGGVFSFLRRICGVSDPVPTAVQTVDQDSAPSHPAGGTPSLRLYPNPTNAAVTLTFHLEQSANVSVRIYDELGQRVRVLAAEAERRAGDYQYVWDGRDREGRRQASGTYLLVLSVDGVRESRKLTLLH